MNKKNYNMRYIILALVLFVGVGAAGQDMNVASKSAKPAKSIKPVKEIKSVEKASKTQFDDEIISGSERTITVKQPIDFRPIVNVELYDAETEILPARDNNIEIRLEYVAEGKKSDDLLKLHKAIEDHLISITGNTVDITMKFYKSYRQIMLAPGISSVTIELKDNSKIKLNKFKITAFEIYLPADMDLNLSAKYCPVDIVFAINGNVDLKVYDAEISGKRISGNFNAEAKYSEISFESVTGSTSMNLYESKIWASALNDLKLESKYSHLHIDKLKSVNATGYEDEYDFTSVPDASFTVKYTTIEIDNGKQINADLYEGGIEVKEAVTVALKASYADCEFGIVKKVTVTKGYENEMEFNEVTTFSSMEGRYNEITLGSLLSSASISGYEDEIEIELVGPDFKSIFISGKYQEVDLVVSKKAVYKLYGNISYPDLDIDEGEFKKVLFDKEGSNLDFLYHRGKGADFTKEIKLEGYEMNVDIRHQ